MIGDDQLGALVTIDLAAQPTDRSLHADEQLRRELAEAADDLRLEHVELPPQIGRARFDLVRERIAILRWPALEHVADEHGVATERHAGNEMRGVHRLNDLGEELPSAPDERLALRVFVG